MREKLLLLLLGVQSALPALSRDFEYTYEGQTITYTVIDEDAKTCMAKEGGNYKGPYNGPYNKPGNNISGKLILPEVANDSTTDYSVTSIGPYAFSSCSGLKSVEIPNSVISIGESAFESCRGLKSVVIPNSVQTIGPDAFADCIGLTSVVIGNSVQLIGSYAFENCRDLTSVEIPNSVQTIGSSAFSGCSGLTSVVIGNSVTSIGKSASIRRAAFSGCSALTSVVIGNSVQTIGELAFESCSALTSVVIPNSVQTIGQLAFKGCIALTSVTALSVSPAGMNDNSFEGLYDTVKLTVPDEAVNSYLTTNWSHFRNIQNNSGKELGSFSDGVLEYRLNPTDMTAMVIGAKSYSNLQIPERFTDDTDAANPVRYYIKGIGYKAFDGKGVNSVKFNSRSQMEYIGDYAFAQTNISSISIPESVVSIGDYAFYNTSKLSEVELKEGLETIGRCAFSAEKSRFVTGNPLYVPSTVKSVGWNAFQNFECSQVNISDLAVWYKIDFDSVLANPLHGSSDGLYVDGKKLTRLEVPEDIKEIKPYAFYNCKQLKEVTFPEGLKRIGSESFFGCYYFYDLKIPSSVVEIGEMVFGNEEVTFSDGLSPIDIRNNSFYNGVQTLYWGRPLESLTLSLKDVTSLGIGNLITEIPEGRFKDLKMLQSLSLGSSVENIGNGAFSGCYYLRDLKFASELQTIGDEAFCGCTSLKEVILPPSVETIGASAFAGNSNLASIIMGHKVKTIGDEAFCGCTILAEVILPPSVETIGASAFAGNSNLASIIMGHKVKTIGEKAFDGCQANTVCITAQIPPTAPNNTFSNYTGKLYLQGEKAKDAYYDAFTCWDRFDSYVMIDAEEIKIEGADKIYGKAGDTFQLKATVWPENVTLPQIFWRSTNPEIATVDGNGLVTLHVDLESLKTRASGEGDIDDLCTIIAETLYNDGPIAQIGVTAEDTPILAESITLSQESWSAHAGETVVLTATVHPEDTTDKTVTWTSSDDAIATVDAEGNVTAVAVGEADITATCGSVSASSKVTVNPILVESITLSQESWSAHAGETVKITATVLPEDTTDKTVTWTSSNDAVATVDADGNVTAVAVGDAEITATCGSVSATCKVTVLPILAKSISLSQESWSAHAGETVKITATVLPEDTTDKTVTWTSSDDAIASVDAEGNVTAVAVGEAEITATCGSVSATCKVTILPILAESISISQENWSAHAGDTVVLTATVLPEDTTDKTVTWTSSNDAVATVDAEGNVTAVAVGEADITATCGSVSASCKVTVLPILVESLAIDPTLWSGEEGSEFTIKATVLPENAEDKTLTFESSDTSVATVDAEGNVKVLKEGTCVITVSTVDGSNLKAECVVTGLSGVEAIFADPNALVDVYDMNGVMLKKGCSREKLKQLKPAVYILRNGVTVVKAVVR